MISDKMKNERRPVLASTLVVNLCIGFGYSWSVFAGPLTQTFGWTLTEVSIAFTISNLMFTFVNIIGGRIQDLYGPVLALRLGTCLIACGLILCSFTNSLLWLYVSYGLVYSAGTGLIYCAILMNINNFYPDKKGFISGIVTAFYGMSAVVLAPISSELIESFGILTTFRILAALFFTLLMGSSFFMKAAPKLHIQDGHLEDESPLISDKTGSTSLSPHASENDKNWRQMLCSPLYYLIFFMMTIGSASGLMIISQASLIAQNTMLADVRTAALTVSCITAANAFGRIFWGFLSDKLGRFVVLPLIYFISLLMMLVLSRLEPSQYTIFTLTAMLIALCYGGIMGIFPALTTDSFGSTYNGTNYSIVLLGCGLGSLVGPIVAAWTQSITPGDYDLAFYISAALSSVGLLLTFAARRSFHHSKLN